MQQNKDDIIFNYQPRLTLFTAGWSPEALKTSCFKHIDVLDCNSTTISKFDIEKHGFR